MCQRPFYHWCIHRCLLVSTGCPGVNVCQNGYSDNCLKASRLLQQWTSVFPRFISILFIILPVAGTVYSADLWRKAKNNKQPPDANYGSTSSMQKHTSTSKTEKTQTHEAISRILPLVDGSKQSRCLNILFKIMYIQEQCIRHYG